MGENKEDLIWRTCVNRESISCNGSMLALSDGACAGSWWHSTNNPSIPVAAAALARGSMNSRLPDD